MIADVVTPLLGLDSMIKDSLSLHVEYDLQDSLSTQQEIEPSLCIWEDIFI